MEWSALDATLRLGRTSGSTHTKAGFAPLLDASGQYQGDETRAADTTAQLEVEDWIRRNWLPQKFGQKFHRERLRLSAGGLFDFDAVSDDEKIVAVISTSGAKTRRGRAGAGKLVKIRSDVYFLLLVESAKRIVVFTEQDMFGRFNRERHAGRIPHEIESYVAEIPPDLRRRLEAARKASIDEFEPSDE